VESVNEDSNGYDLFGVILIVFFNNVVFCVHFSSRVFVSIGVSVGSHRSSKAVHNFLDAYSDLVR
jgi:hypothetical protein